MNRFFKSILSYYKWYFAVLCLGFIFFGISFHLNEKKALNAYFIDLAEHQHRSLLESSLIYLSVDELRKTQQQIEVIYGEKIKKGMIPDTYLCIVEPKQKLINDPLLSTVVSSAMSTWVIIEKGCDDNFKYYLERFGLGKEGIGVLHTVIVADNKKYFSYYLDMFGGHQLLEAIPNLHIYAAYERSCNVLKMLLDATNNEVAYIEQGFFAYKKERCGQ